MAKFCTNCGHQLEEGYNVCLNCGRLVNENNTINNGNTNKQKKKFPTWAIVLIVVGCVILIPIILLIVFGFIGYNVIKDSGVDIEDYFEEILMQQGTIGDTLTSDDFRITLTDAFMYSSIEGEYRSDVPAEGKEYLVFFFNVENITTESEYISSYDFSGYVDGYAINRKYLYNDIDDVKELGVNLASGMKTDGFVAFEVDKTWKEFEIHYDGFLSDSELVFKVVNEDNSSNSGL